MFAAPHSAQGDRMRRRTYQPQRRVVAARGARVIRLPSAFPEEPAFWRNIMRKAAAVLAGAVICAALPTATTAADAPRWPYPANNPDYKPPVDDGKLVRVPNSTAGYTWSQLRDRFIAPVWHPGDHAPLPEIVATGRKPDVFACGFCHRADGPGGPENADLAGLPKRYILQRMGH